LRGKTMMLEVEVIKALCNVHGEYNVFSKSST
jgi:hypothetical protein